MKHYTIIVGGGSGSRMQSEMPKQFLLLNGLPILMHTINAFHRASINSEIILVLNVHQHQYWETLCEEYRFDVPHQLVRGGEQRFHSVKNGLKQVKGKAIVAIHDAVRPLVSDEIICKAFELAAETGNAITAIPSKDSIRQSFDGLTKALSRETIYLVQTPQVFNSDILKKAYEQFYRNDFTDDASVVEKSGVNINLVQGEEQNIKITYPLDIQIAEVLLNTRNHK